MSDPDDKEDEGALFRASVSAAKPLQTDRIDPYREKVSPRARFREADEARVLVDSLLPEPEELELYSGDHLRFRRTNISEKVLRRLGRGFYRIDSEIDLHGLTESEACDQLAAFIADALERNNRVIRVVHGKGLRSGARGPVLKKLVNRWLRKSAAVLAFISTPPTDGGTGAVYVMLDHG